MLKAQEVLTMLEAKPNTSSKAEAKNTDSTFDEKAVKKAIDTLRKSVTSLGNGLRPLEGTAIAKVLGTVDGEAGDKLISVRQDLEESVNELSALMENIQWQLNKRED